MEYIFSIDELAEIEKIKAKYPEQKAALMPILWLAQKKFGWISNDVEILISNTLNLPLAHIHGVATFYSMYFKKEMGTRHIQVCTNVSCKLCGGDELLELAKKKLGVDNMERSADGAFSLEEVECMGACGGAPMVAVNEDFYENMTPTKFKELLNQVE